MFSYLDLKTVHVTCAALSISGFALRGYWMLRDSPRLRHPLTRILPHVNDTLLLLAAIGLMLYVRQYPLVNGWLTAKVVALVAYVVLGTIAIKRGRTRTLRASALVGAAAVFAYIVAVALSRQTLPGFAYPP